MAIVGGAMLLSLLSAMFVFTWVAFPTWPWLQEKGGDVESDDPQKCPGTFDMPGYGKVSVVPTGWGTHEEIADDIQVQQSVINVSMGGRGYLADECTPGKYDHSQYLALNLLGKALKYTMDLSGAVCGCNAAMYLVSMRQNELSSSCKDYYCDANSVCGVNCAEIDIQEANMFAWHSTLHSMYDAGGTGGGYGGDCASFGKTQYGPGSNCVNTKEPFDVVVSFPTDGQGSLTGMEVELSQSQDGKRCQIEFGVNKYDSMNKLSQALSEGMTPTISYWNSSNMQWLDGKGSSGQGPCQTDTPDDCADTVKFYGFSVEAIHPPTPGPTPGPAQCAAAYQQCGGVGWKGATCCVKGYTCRASSQYYSQCLPNSLGNDTIDMMI